MMVPIWESIKNYQPFNEASSSSHIGLTHADLSFQENKAILNTNYGFEVMTKEDIPDILYFSRYAECAYSEIHSSQVCGEHLIYFSNTNDLFKSPFLITKDHKWKCVVISIRGTYSAADWLVDLQIEPEAIPIPELGPDKRHYTHKGIYFTAKNILRELKENDRLRKILDDPALDGYEVVVTGHSLGAVCNY